MLCQSCWSNKKLQTLLTLHCTLYTVNYLPYRPELSTPETNQEGEHMWEMLFLLLRRLGWISTLGKWYSIFIAIRNCSAPNLAQTPAEPWQWTAVWGSIIIHHPTTTTTTTTTLYYSPKKSNCRAPSRDINLKFSGLGPYNPNLKLELT